MTTEFTFRNLWTRNCIHFLSRFSAGFYFPSLPIRLQTERIGREIREKYTANGIIRSVVPGDGHPSYRTIRVS